MILSWSPIDGALMVAGSRRTAIDTAWRQVPEADRTPTRRKLAEDVESLCESGDSFGEPLAAGLPISGNPTYQDVFQRVGLTS
jgi:hypothetical protein